MRRKDVNHSKPNNPKTNIMLRIIIIDIFSRKIIIILEIIVAAVKMIKFLLHKIIKIMIKLDFNHLIKALVVLYIMKDPDIHSELKINL